jgi:hypothetical protein
LITPSSHGDRSISAISEQYDEFTALCIDGRVSLATMPKPVTLFEKSEKLAPLANKYRYRYSLLGYDMIYYSNSPFRVVE